MNELRRQGARDSHARTRAFKAGNVQVEAGDYIIRGDQPYRTLVDMYFSMQNYPPANPRPYDDTGWTMQLDAEREVARRSTDKSVLDQPMTLMTADAKARRRHRRAPATTLIIEHTTDNSLVTFRFKHRDREDAARPRRTSRRAAASFVRARSSSRTPTAPTLEPTLKDLGLTAMAVAAGADGEDARPRRAAHRLRPQLGSARRTKAGCAPRFDHYGVPYTYFADMKLREGNLRAKYDVIVFPHVGGNAAAAGQRTRR